MQTFHMEQGSDEWYDIKRGIVSSSHFSDVLNKKTGRKLYMRKVAGEILSGITESSFSNKNMEMGVELEASAREHYEQVNSCDVEQVGFIKNSEFVGTSPDGLVGSDGMIEIKSVLPSTQIATILSGRMPTTHNAQVQGQMWVAEKQWCDFVSWCPALTARPFFCIRVRPDEVKDEIEYVKTKLAPAVALFVEELHNMINQITKSEF